MSGDEVFLGKHPLFPLAILAKIRPSVRNVVAAVNVEAILVLVTQRSELFRANAELAAERRQQCDGPDPWPNQSVI